MSFKSDLYDFLNAKVAITNIIGLNNIFPERAPSSAEIPYIVWGRNSSDGVRHMKGASGMVMERFTFDCYGKSSPVAETISEAMRNALDGFQGLMGSTDVRSFILENQVDAIDGDDDGSQQVAFVISMSFDIWYFRSIPTL